MTFTGDLGSLSPVSSIKLLGEEAHIAEVIGFSMMGHIVLDAGTKSAVEGLAKGIVSIANLGSILVKLNHVLHDSVSVMHPEMF